MASRKADFLIVGGGQAGASAAETLRDEGATGTILLLCAEPVPPYRRPPLSKQYLLRDDQKDRILIHPEPFYRSKGIELALGDAVVSVSPEEHLVRTAHSQDIAYGKLLIATGSTARTLDLPGATLLGVHRLRTRKDADSIRTSMVRAHRALVVGGSILGIEIATTLLQAGLTVTVVESGAAIMPRLYAPPLSSFFADRLRAAGADLVTNDEVVTFEGESRVAAAVLRSGRRIACEIVVSAIGVVPETSFLAGSGLALDDGVIVDDRLRASVPDIFAAGEVANFFDRVFGRRRRIEHWDNAVKQGRLAARNMLDQNLLYDEVSYFFADIFDLSFTTLGAPEDGEELIPRGSLERHSYCLFYLRNDRLRAVFSMGRPASETRALEVFIRERVNIAAQKRTLPDEGVAIDTVPAQTVLILQGGGALGAFECGVVRAFEEAEIYPDIVAGVSIGAFNGAIIASHPKNATEALDAFWRDLAVDTPNLLLRDLTQAAVAWQIFTTGVPRFFAPRWLGSWQPPNADWISLYDTTPMLNLLRRYVDFPALKTSPVRLLVSAVNVETGALKIFDSYVHDLTPEHILASGSLPPGFPWTTVDGKPYWDGAIISNSPLDLVIERCGASGKRVFIVDLFAERKPLPRNLIEVMARRDEILFAERLRNSLRTDAVIEDFRKLVEEMMGWLDADAARRMRERPRFIQLMGKDAPMSVTRILREGELGEPSSRDYDFSRDAITRNRAEGYRLARVAIGQSK